MLERLARAAVLAAGLFALAALIGALRYGYPNNGDFSRYSRPFVSGPVGQLPPRATTTEERRTAFRERGWHRYWTLRTEEPAPRAAPGTGSTPWLWAPGLAIHRLVRPGTTLDLTYLGILPRLLILAATFAMASITAREAVERRVPWLLLAIAPWPLAFTASSMTAYFNSFYREAGTFSFAALFVVALTLASRLRPSRAVAAILATGALLASTAPAHGPLAGLAAVAAIDLAWQRRGGAWNRPRKVALAFGIAAVVAFGVWRVATVDGKVRQAAAFNALFLGVLPLSQEPADHLARLGLPIEAGELIGRSAFEPASRTFRAAHGDRLVHGHLLDLMRHEPVLVPRVATAAAALVNHTSIRGRNLWAGDDARAHGSGGWNAWGELQARFLPRGIGYWAWIAIAIAAGIAARLGPDTRLAATGRLVAVAAAASALELAVNFLGDGPMTSWRHLMAANFFLGSSVAAMFWLVLQWRAARGSRRVTTPA